MEVARGGDDALVAWMASRVPAGVPALSLAFARILASGTLDVIAVGDGNRNLV